jgi:TPR repeat protein
MPLTSCAAPEISPKMEKLTESARQGDVYDQLLLGYKYYNGLDVPQDFKKALKWYRKAAEQGAVDAQIYLGTMYHNGEGTDVDYVQAYMWFDLAAQQGHQRGEELRGLISEKMGPDDIAKAQKMTEKYDFKQ